MAFRRIHITGGPGSGKTTAGRYLSATLGLPLLSLDYHWHDTHTRLGKPHDDEPTRLAVINEIKDFATKDAWLTEGAFLGWAEPLLARAELIVWMQAPWRIASYRILSRHVRAELARDNPFPGWHSLYSFWRWSARFYAGTNPAGLNIYGTPNTLATLSATLEAYRDKIVRCSSRSELAKLARNLQGVPA